ncbi:coiled-coil domain-containing protein 62 isoform X1 [Myiozetetes cayanensis]|uniref:coiled-coil domain-containing protein 62 isoform X1 n=1 Tax=Myiozetetes cayanensis TaxID=478635 RepID=UPI00215F23DF|nr:coiled-coil domain-containing protein 62 isoform X1 [Myiozetetes cayanensis]XP_050174058.1 coiled-coil domain-containing protein 62 isoform X1 [Myiozetetes cayanensis]XP_050174059.1 coiled-coil domain-containing protein 62 isoform X1 [Myiozetetes cayanensis]
MSSSLLRSSSSQALSPDRENSIIKKQRQELQLLIAELKERDRELNDMVAVHQRHIQAWEGDRHKILTLAERCSLLTSELNNKNGIIKSLTKRLKFLESQRNDSQATLENTQQKFKELTQKVTDSSVHCQALEEKNQDLHCSVLQLSVKTGQLQAREQELLTMLRMKDNALIETTDHINEFTCKLKKLESALRAVKSEDFCLNREQKELKLTLKELMLQTNKLKDVLSEKMEENSKQHEEILHLKHENGCLKNELALAVEKAERKDELYQFAKSKQARIEKELSSLRQVFVKQQSDLQFLHGNSESPQASRQKHEKMGSRRSTGVTFSASESHGKTHMGRTEGSHTMYKEWGTAPFPESRVKTTLEMCGVDNRQLLNASDLEETTSAFLKPCQKVVKGLAVPVEEGGKQDVASSFDELDSEIFREANGTRPLGNREIGDEGVESRDRRTFETSIPSYERWLNIRSRVDLQSTLIQNGTAADKAGRKIKTGEERPGVQSGQKRTSVIRKSESDSCLGNSSASGSARWKPVTDQEWLEIFKPIERDGSVCSGKDCSCLDSTQ